MLIIPHPPSPPPPSNQDLLLAQAQAQLQYLYPGINQPLRLWPLGYVHRGGNGSVHSVDSSTYPHPRPQPGIQDHPVLGIPFEVSPLLEVREVGMIYLMNEITELKGWERDVFDEDKVQKWRERWIGGEEDERLWEVVMGEKAAWLPRMKRGRVVTGGCFNFCIAELRAKATSFLSTNLIPVLDIHSDASWSQTSRDFGTCHGQTVIKSNTIVSSSLHQDLVNAFTKLEADQSSSASGPNWRPGTNSTVQDLVDPNLYPFIFGRSHFIQEEVVGLPLSDSISKWSGKGQPVPLLPGQSGRKTGDEEYYSSGLRIPDRPDIPDEYWSEKMQWLPSNFTFGEDGKVKFTSYINDLHPVRYAKVYSALEKLINEAAIPAWNKILFGARNKKRCKANREGWMSTKVYEDDEDEEGRFDVRVKLWEKLDLQVLEDFEREHGPIVPKVPYPDIQDNDGEFDEDKWLDREMKGIEPNDASKPAFTLLTPQAQTLAKLKWHAIREPLLPDDWFPDWFDPSSQYVSSSEDDDLRNKYQSSGIQVVIKSTTISLTPSNPSLAEGKWQLEGQLNERILANYLYCLDAHNVVVGGGTTTGTTGTSDISGNSRQKPVLSFRVPTHSHMAAYGWQGDFEDEAPWMGLYIERIYGTCISLAEEDYEDANLEREEMKGRPLFDPPSVPSSSTRWSQGLSTQFDTSRGDPPGNTLPVQTLGHIPLTQGKIIAWPNTMHHQLSGFELEDKTQPGRVRLVQISLVDPEQKIVSTANVPPQSGDWFGEALLHSTQQQDWVTKVPREVLELLMERGGEGAGEVLNELRNSEGEREANRPHLPTELMDIIRKEVDDGLMTRREAEEIRIELMEERERYRRGMEEKWEERRMKWYVPPSWQAWMSLNWPRPMAP